MAISLHFVSNNDLEECYFEAVSSGSNSDEEFFLNEIIRRKSSGDSYWDYVIIEQELTKVVVDEAL